MTHAAQEGCDSVGAACCRSPGGLGGIWGRAAHSVSTVQINTLNNSSCFNGKRNKHHYFSKAERLVKWFYWLLNHIKRGKKKKRKKELLSERSEPVEIFLHLFRQL